MKKSTILRYLALARGRDPIKSGIFRIINNITYIIILIIVADLILSLAGKIEAFSFTQATLNFISNIFVGMHANNSSSVELGSLLALLLIVLIFLLMISIILWHNQKRHALKLAQDSQANRENLIRIKERCSNQSKCFKDIR